MLVQVFFTNLTRTSFWFVLCVRGGRGQRDKERQEERHTEGSDRDRQTDRRQALIV